MATITITIDDNHLWSSVFGSGFETWSWWSAIDYGHGDWDAPDASGIATLTIDDPEQPESSGCTITKELTILDLARGYQALLTNTQFDVTPYGLDFDAVSGDAVLQFAIFGEVVFG